jgi:hypothetical protein
MIFHTRWLTAISVTACLALVSPQPAAADLVSGLYAYVGHPDLPNFAKANASAIAENFIDGAAIVVPWQEIEPQPGVYDWSILDRWVVQTVSLHKKLSVGIIAGLFAPAWLYGPGYGVPKNSFDYNRSSIGVFCTVMTQPSFWAPPYLQAYGVMMAALALHLRTMKVPGMPPGAAYAALEVVKLSGINNTTEELRVDVTKPDNGPCHQSDATAIWAAAGFTPDRAVSAFMKLAAETTAAFPGKVLSVPIIINNAFPAIDGNGQIEANDPKPDPVMLRILAAAVPVYHNQLMVQWDALWQGRPPTEVAAAGEQGARMGWQMNGFAGSWGGSGCIYPGFKIGACKSEQDFQSILDNGINLGGQYIEVQVPSVINTVWQPAFKEAHQRLQCKRC